MRYSGNPEDLIVGGVLHRTTIDPSSTPLSLGERRRRAKRRRSRSVPRKRSRSRSRRLREISGRSFAAGSKERGRRAAETTSVKESKMALSLFGERKRSRKRSRRRSREATRTAGGLFGGERKRRRSRKMGRVAARARRSRERSRSFGGLFGAPVAAERRRRRRSRSRSRSRSRGRRRSREVRAIRVGERRRRRSRSRSRIRSRIRSGAKRALGYSERRRRRSRSRRRSYEPMFAVGERRRRRRSRSRSRRRSREMGLTRFLGERRRRRSGGRRRSRVTGRFMNFGGLVRNGDFTNEVLKPGAIAAVGLVGTRLLSQQVGKLTASIMPSSPTLAKWVPSAVSAVSAYGVWYVASKVQALRPHRGFLAIGAGLAVVEELLAVVLPMVGLTAGQAGLAGMLGNALYGTDNGLGFPCFTGTCPQGVSVPFPNPPCTACPPGAGGQVTVDVNGNPVAMAGMGGGLGFPCFTGTCPQGVSVPFPNPPCTACPPNGGGIPVTVTGPNGKTMAANVAVAQSGFTDPVAQQVLAGLTGKAQEILSGAGM